MLNRSYGENLRMGLSKLIWAVDAFDSNKKLKKGTVRLLRILVQKADLEIEPAYVLSAGQFQMTEEWLGPSHYYRPAAEKAVQEVMNKVHLPHLLEPHILIQDTSSIQEAVEVL